jgi:predicted TIM-barrel fold metal-dependent hydrolase
MTLVAVDMHTHVGQHKQHVRAPLAEHEVRAWGKVSWDVTLEEHRAASRAAAATVVLAFDAEPVGVMVPDDYVAGYVAGHDDLIGFASVNPNRSDATGRLHRAVTELGLRGLKLGPTYQHFHPHDQACLRLLEQAQQLRIPVLWHQGTTFTAAAIGEYARPLQLDLVARRFPDLRMCIAHFGHPWVDEALTVARRHEHFFVDVSALDTRPWQLARALASAAEYRVLDRLLFGSDFPFSTVEQTVAGLGQAAALCRRLGIAEITDEHVSAICRRDTLRLLGLDPARQPRASP